MSNVKWVYLDVCVLCRPFDDQQQARIHLETIAYQLILGHIREGKFNLLFSPVHQAEIGAISQVQERENLLFLLSELGYQEPVDLAAVRRKAEKFVELGLGVADAAHLAFAEQVGADFITVDDRLLKKCQQLSLPIWCGSPQAYCDKESLL